MLQGLSKFTRITGCLLIMSLSVTALAQSRTDGSDYPNRPVRFLATQPPGGAIDFIARLISQKMSESMGQQFVVENRAGGSGIIATEMTAKAAPDGYTMVIVGPSFVVSPALYPNLPYDPLKDLSAVSLVSNAPAMLVVHPSLPVRSIRDLIELARAKPGELNFASSANGSSPHLSGELFKSMTGVNMTHVPYKGAAAGITDLIAGRVHLSFASMASVINHAKAGKLRAIATTGARRSSIAPELPTVAESGLPGFETGSWQGVFVPARTPAVIVNRLNREIVRAINLPDIKAKLALDGTEPGDMTAEAFAQWLRIEIPKWTKLANAIGLKVD